MQTQPSFIDLCSHVEKQGSAKDYCTGRTGIIVEIDQAKQRARVLWTNEKNGEPIKIKTWVKWQFLKSKS